VKRVLFQLLVLAAVAATLVGAPAASARAAETDRTAPQTYVFAFRDADVAQVAQEILGQALGVAYTVDPAITTKMTFRIEQRLTKPQLLEAFEAALAASDIALVRDGDTLHVVPRAKAKSAASIRTNGQLAHHAGYEVVAVPLAYAQPSEVAKALESVAPQGTVIYVNDKQGLLLLGGSGQELESALQMVKVFDKSGMDGVKIRWFELTKAPATTVAADLERVLSAAGINGVGVVPLKRLNGLFVFARTDEALDKASDWVGKLDQPSQEKTASLFVYHPKNSSAEALGRTLNSVLSGQMQIEQTQTTAQQRPAGPAGAAPQAVAPTAVATQSQSYLSSGEDAVRIGVDKDTNTLLISAPPGMWIQIQRILDEIDRQPAQVLIEASILEVTLSKDFQFGVDWQVLGAGGRLNVSQLTSASGTIGGQSSGFAITFLDKDIKTAINTLGSKTAVEVISAPKIMALDNHTAKLEVGSQVPTLSAQVQNTTAAGAPIVSAVNYQSTGVILNVTPRVSGDDRITLEVSQEVSEAVPPPQGSGPTLTPTISQTKFESTLVLKSGGVVALGGLISSTKSKGDSGIPYAKDIPGIGALFRTNSNNLSRTELIVLLSAKIIRDDASAQKVMADLLADMREIESRGLFKLPK
jgi:general secretion pathway protein D